METDLANSVKCPPSALQLQPVPFVISGYHDLLGMQVYARQPH